MNIALLSKIAKENPDSANVISRAGLNPNILAGGFVSNPLPTTTPIPVKVSSSGPPASVSKPVSVSSPASTPKTPTQQIKDVAASMTPTQVNKGIDLLASGNGVLTQAQKDLQKLSTSPALLPKTKALKEAEYLATLPQSSASEKMETITGNNYLLYGGVALVAVVILILILKK